MQVGLPKRFGTQLQILPVVGDGPQEVQVAASPAVQVRGDTGGDDCEVPAPLFFFLLLLASASFVNTPIPAIAPRPPKRATPMYLSAWPRVKVPSASAIARVSKECTSGVLSAWARPSSLLSVYSCFNAVSFRICFPHVRLTRGYWDRGVKKRSTEGRVVEDRRDEFSINRSVDCEVARSYKLESCGSSR